MKTNGFNIKKLTLSGLFLALGVVLPYFTGQIKEVGDSLLPMHIPVMIAGFILGKEYGLLVGLILPFLKSIISGMPPIYPNAVWMSMELLTYGFVSGYLYHNFFKEKLWWLYSTLIISMLSGRLVWGIVKAVLLGIANKPFGIEAFLVGGFIDAFPGIIIQLILIPPIVRLLSKYIK